MKKTLQNNYGYLIRKTKRLLSEIDPVNLTVSATSPKTLKEGSVGQK